LEFIISPIFFTALLIITTEGIKNSTEALVRKFLYTFALAHVLIICLFFMDAAYSWVDISPLQIAEKNPLMVFPSFLSLLIVALLVFFGRRVIWGLFLVNILQLLIVIPVLLLVENDTDTSFLSFNTLSMMYLSLAGCFLAMPVGASLIPVKGTRYHEIMYKGRESLLDGLREFAQRHNLEYTAPATIYETGAVKGSIGDAAIEIDTKPSLFPPAYRLRITVKKGPEARKFERKSIKGVDMSVEEIETFCLG